MPAGSTSATTTPLAWFGPLLSTLTNNVTVSPTSADVGVTLFRTATSAFRSTGVCVDVLRLPGFGSVRGVEHAGRVHDRIGRRVAERHLEGRGDGARLSRVAASRTRTGTPCCSSPEFDTKFSPAGVGSFTDRVAGGGRSSVVDDQRVDDVGAGDGGSSDPSCVTDRSASPVQLVAVGVGDLRGSSHPRAG